MIQRTKLLLVKQLNTSPGLLTPDTLPVPLDYQCIERTQAVCGVGWGRGLGDRRVVCAHTGLVYTLMCAQQHIRHKNIRGQSGAWKTFSGLTLTFESPVSGAE